jgi:hypothetical protein
MQELYHEKTFLWTRGDGTTSLKHGPDAFDIESSRPALTLHSWYLLWTLLSLAVRDTTNLHSLGLQSQPLGQKKGDATLLLLEDLLNLFPFLLHGRQHV